MFVFDFWEDFGIVATILVFFILYWYLSKDFPAVIALFITIVITFLVVLPYDWFKWLLFAGLFMFGFWGEASKAFG